MAIFISLAIITVVFIIIAVSAHGTQCHGLSCPSGGGAASTATGTSVWTIVGTVFSALSGIGTLLTGIAAFRKDKPLASTAAHVK